MDAQYIGQNVKRLRSERGLTQQQLGDALGIGFQAVSKWECGSRVPDISIIPAIADFFHVSIDELFMEKAIAYRHKAERLLSVYESDSSCEDNFQKANRAYEELFLKGQYDKKDLADYAFLNELRMEYYSHKAKEYYKEALNVDSESQDAAYYQNQRQYILYLHKIGKGMQAVKEQEGYKKEHPDRAEPYASLALAYKITGKTEHAKTVLEEGLTKFPEDALLLYYLGDIYYKTKQEQEALSCWEKSFQKNDEMIDTQYSLAQHYASRGEIEKAKETYNLIEEWLLKKGYIEESKWVRKEIIRLMSVR